MVNLTTQIIAHLTAPAVWGVISQAFNTPDDQATLRLYHKNPTAMQAMLIAELEQKLAQNPALRAQFAAILADDPETTWHIEAQHVGIVEARQANFQGAQNVTITGLNMPSPLPLSQGARGRGEGKLATMSDDEIIIFCYDNAHHLYAKLPHNRATLRRELLAYLEGK